MSVIWFVMYVEVLEEGVCSQYLAKQSGNTLKAGL